MGVGLIRLILAVSVFTAHSIFGGKIFFGGDVAVELFFIISGFYMAMIINEKYKSNIKDFYYNRFLRLYPLYLSIFIFIFVVSFCLDKFFNIKIASYVDFSSITKLRPLHFCLVLFSNVFIIFQDLFLLLGFNSLGKLSWSFDWSNGFVPLHHFILIKQAWSIVLEILFYAVAPAIVRSFKKVFLVLLLSMSVKMVIVVLGLHKFSSILAYRFFPAELSIFLLGVLFYLIFKKLDFLKQRLKKYSKIFIFCFLLLIIFDSCLHFSLIFRYFEYFLFAAFLPALFEYSKNFKIDRYLGELSYPFYLVHLFVIDIWSLCISNNFEILKSWVGYVIFLLMTIILSILFERVDKAFFQIKKRIN